MAAQTKIYEGIPAGAVFEASQKSLRTLKFTIKKEDSTALSITAKSGMSMKSFGQDVSLIIVEVGPATELTVKTSSGQLRAPRKIALTWPLRYEGREVHGLGFGDGADGFL